jgi:hypothetical protein
MDSASSINVEDHGSLQQENINWKHNKSWIVVFLFTGCVVCALHKKERENGRSSNSRTGNLHQLLAAGSWPEYSNQ